MALQFGNTWWGKKWVDSIEDTEYENRLPRGKRYARNGSVTHIEVSEKGVYAHVKGSRRTPYKVSIALKPFTKEPENIHEVMYQKATKNQNTTVQLNPRGGSENFQSGPGGWTSGTGINQFR